MHTGGVADPWDIKIHLRAMEGFESQVVQVHTSGAMTTMDMNIFL